MKWIGQHIWDFISRFRNKVYFENLEGGSSTTALVVDSEGRVFTNTLSAGGGEASLVRLEVRYNEAVVKGDPVYVSGFHGSGGHVIMSKADSDDAAKMPAFGLADANYAQNATGYAISLGNLVDLDTSSYSVGDTLYVASGGGLTSTKPSTQAKLIQNVGTVSRSNVNNGQVEVTATGRSNDVPNLNNGYIFIGDTNNQAVAAQFSTLLPTQSLAAITTDSAGNSRMRVKGSALDDTSSSFPGGPNGSGAVHTILEGVGWLHTEDIGDRNDINSLPLNIYTGHGQGTLYDSSGDSVLNNSTDVSSGNLTLQSGDLNNTGSGDTTTGKVSILGGYTINNGSGSHAGGDILIRAGSASGTGDCTAGDVTIEQGFAASSSGTTTHGTLKLGNVSVATPVEVLNKLKVKSNIIQDEDGVDCITFDSSGNTTVANTLNATLTGNVTGNASTATALTAGNKTIDGNLTIGANQAGHDLNLYGATTNFSKCMWDASHNQLHFTDQAKIVFGTGGGPGGSDSSIQANGSDLVISNTVGDILIGDSVEITGNLDITGIVRPGISVIKILPRDFIADDVGRPLQISDSTSNRFLVSHSTAKMYASVEIPLGFKATAVDVYGSGTSSMTVYVANINSSSQTSLGNGSIGTTFTISSGGNADTTNYLLIELTQTSLEKVYGGKVTISKI